MHKRRQRGDSTTSQLRTYSSPRHALFPQLSLSSQKFYGLDRARMGETLNFRRTRFRIVSYSRSRHAHDVRPGSRGFFRRHRPGLHQPVPRTRSRRRRDPHIRVRRNDGFSHRGHSQCRGHRAGARRRRGKFQTRGEVRTGGHHPLHSLQHPFLLYMVGVLGRPAPASRSQSQSCHDGPRICAQNHLCHGSRWMERSHLFLSGRDGP
mmetsp:Transcript_21989/g.50137  ORF Transcript_21989/g.50137 Transcript_21989/m.50137 type:complete len:207 (-) Transcript_21989:2161-2781(-)